jgi:hypothetical protein
VDQAAPRRAQVCALILALALTSAMLAGTADANWLTRLGRGAAEVGEAGTAASKLGLGAAQHAAEYVARLPKAAKGPALAAHATPEGHWKFINREGDVFTAASPDELARVGTALAPEAATDGKLALYLSEDTVFAERALLKDLPPDAELHVVAGNDGFRLRRGPDGADSLAAEVRPNITVALNDRKLFDETVFQLGRPLNRSNIRVLALEPGGPQRLSSVPRFDPATKAALVDQIDPASLGEALRKLSGQTVLVTGRVEGDTLAFVAATGGAEQKVFLREISAAAEASDVNLVVVQASGPRQPGGRNWLWQKVGVAGLDEAMKRATFADFLSALGGTGTELAVTAAEAGQGRVVMRAVPVTESAIPLSSTVTDWMGELSGQLVVKAVEVQARDMEREKELDARIVPGIPSALQFVILGSFVLGLLTWGVPRRWWARVWPPEARDSYAGSAGYVAAWLARELAFFAVFLPLVGFPAFLWSICLGLWNVMTMPLRFISWLRSRFAAAS